MTGRSRYAVEAVCAAVFAVSLLLMAPAGHCSEAVSFYDTSGENPEKALPVKGWLIGEKDNVTHAYLCKAMLPVESASEEVDFRILKGAHHAFDFEGADGEFAWGSRQGYRYLYNPEAAATAIRGFETACRQPDILPSAAFSSPCFENLQGLPIFRAAMDGTAYRIQFSGWNR